MDVTMSFDMFFGVEKVYTMFWILVGVFVAISGDFRRRIPKLGLSFLREVYSIIITFHDMP